jgi:hypothetical protein
MFRYPDLKVNVHNRAPTIFFTLKDGYLYFLTVVILSAAKDPSRWAGRCFAEFILSEANGLSMTVPYLALIINILLYLLVRTA